MFLNVGAFFACVSQGVGKEGRFIFIKPKGNECKQQAVEKRTRVFCKHTHTLSVTFPFRFVLHAFVCVSLLLECVSFYFHHWLMIA